jgi:enoyl-CoA hydratase/carnithine racemase
MVGAMVDNPSVKRDWLTAGSTRLQPSGPHAELIASFRRAQADAAHKFGLIEAVAKKGPKAIQAAVETAAKAAKRRDSYAKKLDALGVLIKD